MSEAEIRKYDPDDKELKALMGGKFHDETEERKHTAKNAPAEEQYDAVNPAPIFAKLGQAAKDVCLYAILSAVLFWWQQTGRLETTTSWYALLVCVGMVFFSIGKNCRGGNR